MADSLRDAALDYHRYPTPGKISVNPTKAMATQRDLALAYSPGVAEACLAIVADPREAGRLTSRANLVAVITNGSAVLGLGNIGALASKPVMEGKACLFKKFAGVDVFDIELDEADPDALIDTIARMEPTFGGINLEDIKAPDFLKDIAGLETKRINQLVVGATLETSHDANIFAIGDCAACVWAEADQGKGGSAPPRAQAAHQQASHMVNQIRRRLDGKPLVAYRYRDFGSLVSLGEFSTVGNMMGGLIGGSLMIEGLFARLMYVSLYKMHELALHGPIKVALDTLARLLVLRTEPHVKLH